jgi:hypothetical protein
MPANRMPRLSRVWQGFRRQRPSGWRVRPPAQAPGRPQHPRQQTHPAREAAGWCRRPRRGRHRHPGRRPGRYRPWSRGVHDRVGDQLAGQQRDHYPTTGTMNSIAAMSSRSGSGRRLLSRSCTRRTRPGRPTRRPPLRSGHPAARRPPPAHRCRPPPESPAPTPPRAPRSSDARPGQAAARSVTATGLHRHHQRRRPLRRSQRRWRCRR